MKKLLLIFLLASNYCFGQLPTQAQKDAANVASRIFWGIDSLDNLAQQAKTALQNRLRKDMNLSDLDDAAAARTNLSLGNVNNTSDANKPVSTATQTALNTKASIYVGTDGSANDSYSITASPTPSGYFTGMVVLFRANTANTTGCSINVNGLGAKNIVKRVNTTTATGDILALMWCYLVYDGSAFVILNPVVN